jgi:predicted RNA binding protein YcfA (HicA-like mRNA interferase family)
MSTRLPRVSAPELVRALLRAGFRQDRQAGSHVTLERGDPEAHVTVPLHGTKPLAVCRTECAHILI